MNSLNSFNISSLLPAVFELQSLFFECPGKNHGVMVHERIRIGFAVGIAMASLPAENSV
jgi:hypothetical protein